MAKRPKLGVDLTAQPPVVDIKPANTQPRKPTGTQSELALVSDVPEATGRAGYKTRTRVEKPHVSLYAAPETLHAIKRLALDKGTTAQALYRRGLLLMLQENGLYLDRTEEDI